MRATQWQLPRGAFVFERVPKIMAIINVTPDSFSDGGVFFDPNAAWFRCLEAIEEGADILDIGGESTRPGAEPVSEVEEIRRVVPLVQRLRAHQEEPVRNAVISIDTTKAAVAEAALRAGADIINDISGMRFDEAMPQVVAKHGAAVILMHTPGRGDAMHAARHYDAIDDEVLDYLQTQLRVAQRASIPSERIAIDPGFGFGKDSTQNLRLLRTLPRFIESGYPVLVGVSRKRMIRASTGPDLDALDHGSSVVHAFATAQGAQLLRVHNVRAARAAVAMAAALYEPQA